MIIDILASSSSGNAYLINNELLLECGLPFKKLINSPVIDFRNLKACLVTHEHKDHSRSSTDLLNNGIEVYMSKGTAKVLQINSYNLKEVTEKEQFTIDNYIILPFDVEHDAAQPLGYLIQDNNTDEKILFLTDSYYSKYSFVGINYIMIECNYVLDILEKNVESGIVHPRLKDRILTSHFSLEHVKGFLRETNLSQVRQIILIHLSKDNSDPVKMQKEISEEFAIETVVARPGLRLELQKDPY